MRFYKAKIISITTILVLGIFVSPSYADNTNPPKFVSVEQVTKGPYSIGDVVTYKVNYTGGNPGIRRINIYGAGSKESCVTSQPILFSSENSMGAAVSAGLTWDTDRNFKSFYPEPFLISGVVMPCPRGNYPIKYLSIVDSTGLGDALEDKVVQGSSPLAALIIEVKPFDFITPIGEIKPIKIKDSVSLKSIPKTPKSKTSFDLPRLTQNGIPVSYFANGSCSIAHKTIIGGDLSSNKEGDLGGTITFNKAGPCNLTATPMWTDKYAFPIVVGGVKFVQTKLSVMGLFNVKK